jgi:hypothetical protein
MAKCFPQFDHNYNQVSRELMYNWFNKHLHLGQSEPVVEKPFVPVPPKELSAFDEAHPRPKDAIGAEALRKNMAKASEKQMAALYPKDAESLKDFRRVVGSGLRVLINDKLPKETEVESRNIGEQAPVSDARLVKLVLGRKGAGEQIPAIQLRGQDFNGTVVIWIHPDGKGSLFHEGKVIPAARSILDKKAAILAPDVFMTGEFQGAKSPAVHVDFAGFTFGYNRPLLANRVHDILTVIGFAKGPEYVRRVHLAGFGKAGPWVLLARGLCGDAVDRTAVDGDQFLFDNVSSTDHEMMLSGALKYGGLAAFAALCPPRELYLHNYRPSQPRNILEEAYKTANAADKLSISTAKATEENVIDWLLR